MRLCLLVPFLLASPVSPAAGTLPDYDLSSLHFMAADIVLAQETKVVYTRWDHQSTVRVEKVYKGDLRVGAELPVHLDSYRRDRDCSESGDAPLERMLLFLGEPSREKTWAWPVPSGVKIVRETEILGFAQFGNPGPYEPGIMKPERASERERGRPYLFADLERDIGEAARHVENFQEIAAIPDYERRNARMIAFLRAEPQRIHGPNFGHRASRLMEAAAEIIAASKAPAGCFEATKLVGWSERFRLHGAMKTPEGREFLLRKLDMHTNTIDDRLRSLDAIGDVRFVDFRVERTYFDADVIDRLASLLCDPEREIRIRAAAALERCASSRAWRFSGEVTEEFWAVERSSLPALERAIAAERDGWAKYHLLKTYAALAELEEWVKLFGDGPGLVWGLEIVSGPPDDPRRRLRWGYERLGNRSLSLRNMVQVLERLGKDGRTVEERRAAWGHGTVEVGQRAGGGGHFVPDPPLSAGRWRIRLEAETNETPPRKWRSLTTEFKIAEESE